MGEWPNGDLALRYDGPTSLGELVVRPARQRDALCREHPEVDFFPERGQSAEPGTTLPPQVIVIDQCLAFAMASGEVHGIYGDLSGRQRRALRREQAKTA